jgi:hypothetical protein
MATRLLQSKIGPAAPPSLSDSTPWISSGVLTASTVIKAKAGVLGGVLVTATDAGGDIDVIVWDSPTSTLTGDVALCRVPIPTTVSLTQESFGTPSQVGVEATLGIYVQVVAGDCEIIVYYR